MAGTAIGEPGVPRRFVWRGQEHEVDGVIERWKELSGCRSGADERYVRKHWYHLHMTDGSEVKIYFERQARSKRERKARWWLYSITDS